MVEIEQCRVVVPSGGGPFQVKHSKSCASDYCAADYAAEQANRRKRNHQESKSV